MDAAYLSAVCPEPVQLLGTRLRPFCLGHWLLLTRHGNGFLTGHPTAEDLVAGILTCSLTFEEGAALWNAPDRDQQVEAWTKQLTAACLREHTTLNLVEKSAVFAGYLSTGQKMPAYIYEESDAPPVGSPWPQVLKLLLMSELGMSETEVYNRPLTLCWWDYLGWRELNDKGVKLLEAETVENYELAQKRADANHEWLVSKVINGS